MVWYLNIRTQQVGALIDHGSRPATVLVATVSGTQEWDAVDAVPLD